MRVKEKGVITDIFCWTGCNIGSILGSWSSGVINVYLGWQANFYINAAIALFFGLMWCFFVSDKPEQNSRVGTEELIFISSNIIQNEDESSVKQIPPFLSIFRSIKVWALVSYLSVWFYHLLIHFHPKTVVIPDDCNILWHHGILLFYFWLSNVSKQSPRSFHRNSKMGNFLSM